MWQTRTNDYEVTSPREHGWRSFCLALFLPLGNPKAVGFYAALLPAFMDVENLSIATATQFSLVIVAIWSIVLIGYTALADIGRRRFQNTSLQRWLYKGSAAAMVGAAGAIVFGVE